MIPDDDHPNSLYKKEDIKMQLDKIEIIERKLDGLTNRFEALLRSNKAAHDKIWLELDKGGKDDT